MAEDVDAIFALRSGIGIVLNSYPFYFCIGVLIATSITQLAILIAREVHHSRIQAGLIDKILEQHGLNAIPKEHPLAEIIQRVERKAEEPTVKPIIHRIPIPGMSTFQREYNRVMKVKEKADK